jgi:thiamine biosynthesis lipoprotein
VRIGPGQSLDLGGIAKGWIGTELAKELEKSGAVSAMIDLGGNIALVGPSSKGRDWMIGIQVPEAERGEAFAAVRARGESVITSGDYERFIAADGKVFGHILSAETGRPVPMTMSSVTVVDPDGAKADAWCTAFFAMGLDKTLEYMRTHPQMRVLVLGADKKTVWVSESLAARVTLIDDLKMNVVRAQKPDLSEGKN